MTKVTAIILAGGRGSRLNAADKGMLELIGKPLIRHVIDRIAPQVDDIVVSHNRNVAFYQSLGFKTIADATADYAGPLAGIAAAARLCATPLALICPCDTPLLPGDLVARLAAALQQRNADFAIAHDGERAHPIVALTTRELLQSAAKRMLEADRSIKGWQRNYRAVTVDFGDCADCFTNINTAADLAAVEQLLITAGKQR